MLFSDDMTSFCLACEALSCRNDTRSYQAVRGFLEHPDKYRRLYAMKTVFRNPASAELMYVLEDALSSGDVLFINAACDIIAEHEFRVSESKLRRAANSKLPDLFAQSLYSLKILSSNEENFAFLLELLRKAEQSLAKEILGELLADKYLPEKASTLFEEFCSSDFPAIRILAAQIGKSFGFDLSGLCSDKDGHVRKAANK